VFVNLPIQDIFLTEFSSIYDATMESKNKAPFRVVIVGGGPVGLATAHCLDAAEIDYIVLERRKEIVEMSGAGLGLWPQSVRMLSQLGILEEAQKLSGPMKMSYQLNPDGSEISGCALYDMIEER
jgi:2-polyprenyl-6-methoxyphenol hydroxylase-like FAD-dependent oxidoreductase